MRSQNVLKIALLLPALLIVFACNRDVQPEPTPDVRVDGACQTIFNGEICTYGLLNGENVVEYGATVSLATVENAPLNEDPVFPPVNLARIPFPDEVRSASGVDHLGINWEVQGHPPQTFQTPHFDFHFYMTDPAAVDGIDCSDTSKPNVIPAGYVLPDFPVPNTDVTMVGMCVPQMGMHAANAEEAAASELFDATMIVGYYSKQPIFVEPMITQDLLLSRADFKLTVPAVDADKPFPVGFEGSYDETLDSYTLKFRM